MAVVVFDPAAFKLAFPEFADVPDARLTAIFALVGVTILDNTGASIVVNVDQRAGLLDLLVAHMLAMFGTGVAGTLGGGPSGVVGRVSSASEGTVSTTLEYRAATSATESWFNQTQYGAMYWALTAQFRSFRYVAAGRSGVGHSRDYLSPRFPGRILGANSGTPDGL